VALDWLYMTTYIVLPAYNEEQALPPLLSNIVKTFEEEGKSFKIIVVNDGSRDNTLNVANELSKTLPVIVVDNGVNRGLAETLKNGLIHALKLAHPDDVIITMDADNTHPAGLALRMLRLIREGNDVVIASRYREGSLVRGLSFYRKFLSYGAAVLFKVLFPIQGVRDYTCGYRAYHASILLKLYKDKGDNFISAKGFSCMVDLLLSLRKLDLVFNEVPMILRYDQKPGASKMNVTKTIFETLSLILKRRFLGEPNSKNNQPGI
jgi:dolichol-phosphate mannosyltransferase